MIDGNVEDVAGVSKQYLLLSSIKEVVRLKWMTDGWQVFRLFV